MAPKFAIHQPALQNHKVTRLVPSENHELAQVTEVGQRRCHFFAWVGLVSPVRLGQVLAKVERYLVEINLRFLWMSHNGWRFTV